MNSRLPSIRSLLITAGVMLSACSEPETVTTERLTAAAALAGGDVDGYERVTGPRQFRFPEDHGRHPGYRNEWWYLTGNVNAEDGRRFGYQVTFFANALRPSADASCDTTRWCTDHLWMGHAAISDAATGTHYAAELFSRENPALAGVSTDPFRVWIQDWQLFSTTTGLPWELEVFAEDFVLTLQLDTAKAPVLQGNDGFSMKSPEPGNASYYYSMTRMATSGRLHLGNEEFAVRGDSWLDREWSTSALAADQSGWDWFSLQFNDGTELMYYQLRTLDGEAHPASSGNFTSLMGTQTAITADEMSLAAMADWQAPDGTVYNTAWRMRWQDNIWIVKAVFADQLMDVTFQYWEGAVDILDADTNAVVGRGYLEMVH